MSDEEPHVEPTPPGWEEVSFRIFTMSMAGICSFIAAVFIFVI